MKRASFCAILFGILFSPILLEAQVSIEDLTQDLYWRNIGPANQGGRITDIEARRDDFTKVFISVASGGVWKSENAGTSWEPIFDDYETASIGDIALDPKDPEVIWVGTGESNNRNSVSWGNGVYKSKDGGESFENVGLESTHAISRVLVHPENTDDVCVCATGHLWGYSGERGLFQTTNGGKSWKKLKRGLPDDGKTGCTDLVRDSKNPNILYAAFYHRLRQPWHFQSGGEKGGIYKSTDGGKSWKQLTNGLPSPTGRIGLAIYESNPEILMALVEAERSDTLAVPGSGVYRSEDGGESWTYVNTYNNRPFYYSQIRINPLDDQRVYLLTTTFMLSMDGGKTITNGSPDYEIHGDYHAMWLDPTNKDRYYIGADKGFSLTHDHGKNFRLIDNLAIAQYYRINYDMRDPYYVYGGLQDNGSYATASFSREARGILNDSNWKMHWGDGQDAAANPFDYTEMYSSMENGSYFRYNPKNRHIKRISPSPFNTINYWDYFDQDEEDKISASRFNWSAPLVMSPHNPSHIYVGGNHVYRSVDKGSSWEIISPDLTTNHPEKRIQGASGGITPDNTGAETHCSITNISLSPMNENIIWVGTDDGNIQYTLNGGKDWTNVRANVPEVPEELWVSRLEASHFQDGTAYVSFDGHRSDNFQPWVFATEDYGMTWTKITSGFPANEVVRVIREDLINPNLLFAGSETGVWVSIDKGNNWSKLKLNMPTVSVYDIKIHPRENDLIVGTHGRSAWILDDISPLQQLTQEVQGKDFHLFDQKTATLWENISRGGQRGHFLFAGDNPKTIKVRGNVPRANFDNLASITYYVGTGIQDSLTLSISSFQGGKQKVMKVAGTPGIHKIYWDREFDAGPYSAEEDKEITEIFQSWVDVYDIRAIRRAYSRFKDAETSEAKRRILEPLTGGYLNFDIDERFLIPKASEGSYQLSLTNGKQTENSVLRVRKDPME